MRSAAPTSALRRPWGACRSSVRHAGDVAVPLAGASTVKIRFRCAASDNSDSIFLDDVTLSAR